MPKTVDGRKESVSGNVNKAKEAASNTIKIAERVMTKEDCRRKGERKIR